MYNVHVHKDGDNNKVSGQMGPHSVSVNMQGPGMVTLDTSQQVVQPGEPKPDHSVVMVKDTECKHECSSVSVHSGKHKVQSHSDTTVVSVLRSCYSGSSRSARCVTSQITAA